MCNIHVLLTNFSCKKNNFWIILCDHFINEKCFHVSFNKVIFYPFENKCICWQIDLLQLQYYQKTRLQIFSLLFVIPSQVLSSLQQTVIVQMAAFTLNGSDFYDDMMSSFCITSSGNNRVQGFHQDFNFEGICNQQVGN